MGVNCDNTGVAEQRNGRLHNQGGDGGRGNGKIVGFASFIHTIVGALGYREPFVRGMRCIQRLEAAVYTSREKQELGGERATEVEKSKPVDRGGKATCGYKSAATRETVVQNHCRG